MPQLTTEVLMTNMLPLMSMLAIPATVLLTIRFLNRRDERLLLADEPRLRPLIGPTDGESAVAVGNLGGTS